MELEIAGKGEINIRLTADSSHIPKTHAQLMVLQYEHLLTRIIARTAVSDSTHGDIYSISPAKEESLPSAATLLHHFVEAGAREYPDKPALEFVHNLGKASIERQVWTYRELNDRGDQIAHLVRRYIAPGSIVAVRMQKCAQASWAFVGILKAGCSFLALDPDLPKARQDFILQDSGASILFVDKDNSGDTRIANAHVIELTGDLLDQYPQRPVDMPPTNADATCYCLYTSGTTGTPKGCEITHENAVQAMLAFQRLFAGHWDQTSRWLQFASYWFDVAILEQFWSWSVGITVVGAPRDVVLEDLADFIHQTRITHIDLTPSLARLLRPEDVPSLRKGIFITGGEALKQELIDMGHSTLCNGYGPTEATIGVTMNTFVGTDAKPSNIGRQFDNVGAYVLSPGSETPVLRGAIGELCVSGKLVGKGYLNRPELTAKAFPNLQRFGERVYRTGDLVRILADGSFAFLGRIDTQAKIRGQRLETDEIDHVITASSVSAVDALSLVHKDDSSGRETLVAFVATGAARNNRDCRIISSAASRELLSTADKACRSRLPAYMVPTHFIGVDFLPLTINNKADTKLLVSLFNGMTVKDLQRLRDTADGEEALTGNERHIADVLSRMLDLDVRALSRSSNIFSLGMSSISAITFASLLKRKGFNAVNVALMMNNPTITQLASALAGHDQRTQNEVSTFKQARLSISVFTQRHRNVAAQRLCIRQEDIETVTPCTPLQEGLIFDSTRSSERPYFNTFQYLLGNIDLERLGSALQQLSASVQMLRARFVGTDDGYAQVILKRNLVPWRIRSATGEDIERLVVDETFHWLEGNRQDILQPFKAVVLSAAKTNTLVVFAHHALYDGISWPLLMDRLAEAYGTQSLPHCGPSFTEALAHGPLRPQQGAKAFWQQRLAHLQHEPLPSWPSSVPPKTISKTIHISDTRNMETVRKQLGVSHQAFVQACFEVSLLQHYPDTRTYGQVVSGRSGHDGAMQVIGPLFNTLPHVINCSAADTWATMIKRSHDANVAALPFQHTSLRNIRKWCGLQQSYARLFDVIFVFQHQPEQDVARESGLWQEIEGHMQAAYPLAIEVILGADNTLAVAAVSQDSVADGASLDAFLSTFARAVEAVTQDLDQTVAKDFSIPRTKVAQPVRQDDKDSSRANGLPTFVWTTEATVLREAIAQIAGLETERINEHSSMLSIGLDSIDAVKLASKAKRAGLSLPVSKILQALTIPRMLEAINTPQGSTRAHYASRELSQVEHEISSVLRGSLPDPEIVERILPATPNQEALIAGMLLSSWHDYYNHDVLRLRSGIDLVRLRVAWQDVVHKSPILRTGFVQIDAELESTFAQIVYRAEFLQVEEHTLATQDDLNGVLEAITDDARKNHLSRSPFRLTLAHVHNDRYLILSLAHAQYDGRSLALLHEDVRRAYNGTVAERPHYDAVVEASLNATSTHAMAFWSSSLSGIVTSIFPRTDEPEATAVTHRAERASSLSAVAARSFCQSHGVSMQALAQTCWGLVLAHYSGSLDVVYGVVLACRDSEEAEQVMFPAMNTVPVRSMLHGSRADMLESMQNSINDMRPYQRSPLRAIQGACSDIARQDGANGGGSLFDTLFIYQQRLEASDADTEPLYDSMGGNSSVEYPVAVEMEAIGAQLFLRAACKSSVLDAEGTDGLLARLDHVLSTLVATPEEPTVAFAESELSICGLPWFQLASFGNREDENATPVGGEGEVEDLELSPLAIRIREAMAQVAKVPLDSIDPAASMESIGLDSISAIKVAALLRKQDISLSVGDIIRAKTLAKMAEVATTTHNITDVRAMSPQELVANALRERGLANLPCSSGVDSSNIEAILPATAGQVYMLSMWLASHGQLFYPIFSYELHGAGLGTEQLGRAWKELVARHTILRTVFCATEDETVPLLQIVLREVDGNGFHIGGEQSAVVDVKADGRHPMAEMFVLEKSEGVYGLELRIHHALYDAVSLPLLMRDYRDLLSGTPSQPPALRLDDFVALSIRSEARQASRAFWTSYLRDVEPVRLVQPKLQGAVKRVEIFQPRLFTSVAGLERLARAEGVTVQALLFAAHAKVYAALAIKDDDRMGRAGDVVLGIYLANRSHLPDLDRLAVPTLNLVPLRVRSPGEKSLLEVAKQVQANLGGIGAMPAAAAALWEIEEWTGIKLDTFVNFLKLPGESEGEGELGGLSGMELRETGGGKSDAYSRVSAPDCGAFAVPEVLQKMKGARAYQYSLDLEAIVADGVLGVGLFCPEEMLGLAEAEAVVGELKALFENAIGRPRE
ncbi:hypothetical protein LTR08_008545 [Meristemomyces frigidus]|nr:hypothetical protein LTR08_008545 [Meristemomyces frigidus]